MLISRLRSGIEQGWCKRCRDQISCADQEGQSTVNEYNLAHVLVASPTGHPTGERSRTRAETRWPKSPGKDFRRLLLLLRCSRRFRGGPVGAACSAPAGHLPRAAKSEGRQSSDILRSPAGFISSCDRQKRLDTTLMVTQTRAAHPGSPHRWCRERCQEPSQGSQGSHPSTVRFQRIGAPAFDDPSAAKGGDLGWITP